VRICATEILRNHHQRSTTRIIYHTTEWFTSGGKLRYIATRRHNDIKKISTHYNIRLNRTLKPFTRKSKKCTIVLKSQIFWLCDVTFIYFQFFLFSSVKLQVKHTLVTCYNEALAFNRICAVLSPVLYTLSIYPVTVKLIGISQLLVVNVTPQYCVLNTIDSSCMLFEHWSDLYPGWAICIAWVHICLITGLDPTHSTGTDVVIGMNMSFPSNTSYTFFSGFAKHYVHIMTKIYKWRKIKIKNIIQHCRNNS
jgi:hypothetical protein